MTKSILPDNIGCTAVVFRLELWTLINETSADVGSFVTVECGVGVCEREGDED